MLETKKNVADAPLENIIHLLASTSTHAYPALLDMINYFDSVKKLPNKIPFETINDIFTITLNFADTDEDINSVYSKWIRFLLKFSDDPFTIDISSTTATKISDILTEEWKKASTIDETTYNKIVKSSENKICAEILKAMNDTTYVPTLKQTKDEVDSTILCALESLFERHYYDGDTETALDILKFFPRSWRTFWNAHLCDPTNNEYIDALIFMIGNEKDIQDKDTIILQLELKKLVNDVEGKLGEEGYIDPEIIREISRKLEEELSNGAQDNDALVDKFTSKLYEKVVFNKAKTIYNSIPKNTHKEHLVSIYIDIKKVMEFCLEHGIDKTEPILNTVNKVLFGEIKDVASGVALVDRMLKNNSHIKIAQHLTELTQLMESGSIEMEVLFDTLAKYISTEKLSPKQLIMYSSVFNNVSHPQFKILDKILDCFHSGQETTGELAKTMINNLPLFQAHSQSMYIIIEAVLNSRFNTVNIQEFISTLMTAELDDVHSKNVLRLTIEYMHKNPKVNMRKDLPLRPWNEITIKKLNGLLEEIIYEAMEDPTLEAEFEDKKYAIYECRAFIDFLSKKAQRTPQTTKTRTLTLPGETNV